MFAQNLGSLGIHGVGGGGGPVVVPGFVPTADGIPADIYADFTAGNYWNVNPGVSSNWSFARTGSVFADNNAGLWTQFTAGVPAITNKGFLIGPLAVNNVLQCRDMTQAFWTKTNVTVTKAGIVGIDGVSGNATQVTATAANGTSLQTIGSLTSGTYMYSIFLKRVTGSGTINITVDGSTFTAVTLTTSFQRFFITSGTVTSCTVGVQIVTSGDVIVMDVAQLEATAATLSAPSPPIATASAATTKGNDTTLITATVGSAITLLLTAIPGGGATGTQIGASICAANVNNRLFVGRNAGIGRAGISISAALTSVVLPGATWADGSSNSIAASAATNACSASWGGLPAVDTSPGTGLYPVGLIQIALGNFSGVVGVWYVQKIGAWLNHQASDAALVALS